MKEKDIYSKLRETRRSRGLTVNKLAEKMGENHQKVGRIERGTRSLTIDYLLKISKALNTSPEFFLKDDLSSDRKESPEEQTSLLNEIVVLIEENISHFQPPLNPQQKGKLVSKVYELIQSLPLGQRHAFLRGFFKGLNIRDHLQSL